MKVLFIIPKKDPPCLPQDYSAEFRDFMSICLAKKPSQRQSASELKRHAFIQQAPPPTHLQRVLSGLSKSSQPYVPSETLDQPSTVDMEWDFEEKTVKRPNVLKAMGKSVAFEDEFDAAFPEDRHAPTLALGTELVLQFIVPAFQEV